MATRQLAVFVHGWGAYDKGWWRTTKSSLKAHKYATDTQFLFHRFPTTQAPSPSLWTRFQQVVLNKPAHEVVGELGQTLWTTMRDEYQSEGCETIVMFGHSFGGIVIADAVRHGCESARKGSVVDKRALDAIKRIALCASPIGGARLAATYTKAAALFGENVHVKNLMTNDPKRQQAADAFVGFLNRDGAPHLSLFYAANDQIVTRDEVFEPFNSGEVKYVDHSLAGGHSDCIADVGPTKKDRSANFKQIANWLFADATLAARESFDRLMRGLDATIASDPYLSWGQLRGDSDVSDQYMLRFFLQQLNFTASRINDQALGSANLWVAHLAKGEIHLRSEEREGFFATEQLLVHTPGKVTIRANKVFERPESSELNSAGSLAYLRGESVLVSVERSKFPSQSDKETGVTHILGVPLARPGEAAEGVPLAITVDFRFENDPTAEEIAALQEAGRRITQLYRDFCYRWPAGELRLTLK